jgi:hypothetical protein
MFFQNLSKYFQNPDYSLFQLEPYGTYINNQIDFYYDESDCVLNKIRSVLLKIFLFYFLFSSIVFFYVYKKNKLEIIRVENKFLILKNDKNIIKKKYNKLLRMIERIKIISSKEDSRSAKKICLISSELQNRNNYKI